MDPGFVNGDLDSPAPDSSPPGFCLPFPRRLPSAWRPSVLPSPGASVNPVLGLETAGHTGQAVHWFGPDVPYEAPEACSEVTVQ